MICTYISKGKDIHYKRGKNMKTEKSKKNRKFKAKVWLSVLFGALLIGTCNACNAEPAEESRERSMPVTEDVAVILPEAEVENEVTKEVETTPVETAASTPKPTSTPELTSTPDLTPEPMSTPAPIPKTTSTPTPTAEQDDERTVVPTGTDYILNTNTKKFHYIWCSSVDQMKEKNKSYYTGTRDEVIGMGYEPCGRCKP